MKAVTKHQQKQMIQNSPPKYITANDSQQLEKQLLHEFTQRKNNHASSSGIASRIYFWNHWNLKSYEIMLQPYKLSHFWTFKLWLIPCKSHPETSSRIASTNSEMLKVSGFRGTSPEEFHVAFPFPQLNLTWIDATLTNLYFFQTTTTETLDDLKEDNNYDWQAICEIPWHINPWKASKIAKGLAWTGSSGSSLFVSSCGFSLA